MWSKAQKAPIALQTADMARPSTLRWPLRCCGGQEGPGFSMGVVAPAPAELVTARSGQPKAEVNNREEPAGHHHGGVAEDRAFLLEGI